MAVWADPSGFLVLVACVVAGEYVLRNMRAGWQLGRAARMRVRRGGSDCGSTTSLFAGYIGSSLFAALGAVMLMAQIGVGDPQQGANYTLSSITAVVLGGTSLRGGRGTFVGTALGALLLTEVLNAVSFLGLSQTYQYVFQGGLILIAALIFATVRERGRI